tara:strand:- start:66 stop:416 length:351 start_codon:yes stop_codon:yes gene_type:complete
MKHNYTVDQLKDMLLEAQIASENPIVEIKKSLEQEAKDAIDERGIPEMHDIWNGRKTASVTDIARDYDPTHGLTKNLWPRQQIYTVKDFLLLTNQMMFYSGAYFVWFVIILYATIW